MLNATMPVKDLDAEPRRVYDISPDGQHFVMIRGEGETGPTGFKVVQNWFQELKRLVPTEN